ncbi:MAG: bifunctional diaminohydroxyphosphoribosylaminopyrimidine deaminase/5-amino-6-(5-phosphoribosylamino)uracil reductase RibD, partial [Gemmatimonadota bacterium]|nr:bifunctional diaminohydroxyphosphoribosylaminopyrimidine deaminase/5-amino-6-(5-phosphoribosylamino)uracil reductase RibD [Gemmatimonadota bacterium]
VVIAASDPSPEAGGGAELLRAAGIAVVIGVEEAEARELNAAFFHALSSPRPFVTLKLALSLDSALADASGRSRWITGDASRKEVHRLRANSDAIAVGIGTVLADDPSLTVREGFTARVAPRRIVFDREARLPLGSVLARTARDVPTLVLAAPGADDARVRALQNEGVDVVHAGSTDETLLELRRRGVRSLLVEGGARLAGSLLESAVVDRMVIFRAPILLGAGSLGAFTFVPSADLGDARRFAVISRATVGADAMTTYAPRSEGDATACSRESSTTSDLSSA